MNTAEEEYFIEPHIAVDLDETLAIKYWPNEGVYQHNRIGPPITLMVKRVRGWLAEGELVRIFTARVGRGQSKEMREEARAAIEEWCLQHLGQKLPVTCEKDFGTKRLYDDRAIGVEKNTGRLIGVQDYLED